MSNVKWFKYEIIWRKSQSTGHLNCRVMPLKQHENLVVFGRGAITYNPQLAKKPEGARRPLRAYAASECYGVYSKSAKRTIPIDMSYPRTVIDFPNVHRGERCGHPTQKPVALMEYLVRMYTYEGETVLDNVFGSCSTGVACLNTGRNFVGIEKDKEYFRIGQERIRTRQMELGQIHPSYGTTGTGEST